MKFVTQLNFNDLNLTPSLQKLNQDEVGKEDPAATDRELNCVFPLSKLSSSVLAERKSSLAFENKATLTS